MKIVLKDNMAYFSNFGYVPNAPLAVGLDIPGFDPVLYRVSAKINDLPSRACQRTLTIPQLELAKEFIKVDITVTHKGTGIKQIFKMDPVPMKRALLLGGNVYDNYPVSLQILKKDMEEIKKSQKLNDKALVELSKKGQVL